MNSERKAWEDVFYSGAGGEVDRCHALLRFFGDDLSPNDITSRIGILPTWASKKGEPNSRGVPSHTGMWLYETDRWQSGKSPDDVIKDLMLRATNNLDVWNSLSARYSSGVLLVLGMQRWCRGTELYDETIQMLGQRKLKLGIDIYTETPDMPLPNPAN